MKKSEFEAIHRMSDILLLSQEKTYVASLGRFDFAKGKDNVIKLMEMKPTREELDYVRPSDGFSLLHFAITSHNPHLVALLTHWGFNIDLPARGGVTPRKLIEKTGDLVLGMKDAFYYSKKFLQDSGVIVFESIIETDRGPKSEQGDNMELLCFDYDAELSESILSVPERPKTPNFLDVYGRCGCEQEEIQIAGEQGGG